MSMKEYVYEQKDICFYYLGFGGKCALFFCSLFSPMSNNILCSASKNSDWGLVVATGQCCAAMAAAVPVSGVAPALASEPFSS